MTEYIINMDNHQGTSVEITSHDKVIVHRIELAVEHIFKEYREKNKKMKK